MPAVLEGEGKSAFNLRYLTDYLSGREGTVRLSVTTPDSPAVFSHRRKADMVLMPMAVQW